MAEITLEFILDTINKRMDSLDRNIEKYHDSFVKFEEGKLTQALQDIEKNKGDIRLLQQQNNRQDDINVKQSEKRKDWVWDVVKNIIFMLIIPLIGLILIKTGILNITH